MSEIVILKKSGRKRATLRRQHLVSAAAGALAASHFLSAIEVSAETSVSLYWPMGSELDTEPLLKQLSERNVPCLLPVVKEKEQPLFFRYWTYGDPMEEGPFRTVVPSENAEIGIPKILVVPLLAFDAKGFRLGYGGGFYDRTLQALRQDTDCVAVGFAYSGQEIETVTIDQFDQRLDWIVTEKYARKVQ